MPECPIHKGDSLFTASRVNNMTIPLELDIYRCSSEDEELWKQTKEGLVPISDDRLVEEIRRYREMKNKMEKDEEEAQMAGLPSRIERRKMEIAREQLSTSLFRFLHEEPGKHRAYEVNEILQACHHIGLDPKQVSGNSISYVRNYLFDKLGQFESKR